MTHSELSEAINHEKTVKYDGNDYLCVGYQLLRKRNGKKLYSAGLLDLSNNRTILWVSLDKITEEKP